LGRGVIGLCRCWLVRLRRGRGIVSRVLVRRSRFFISDSGCSVRVDWRFIRDAVVILRGDIGSIVSKLVSTVRSEKKVCQNSS